MIPQFMITQQIYVLVKKYRLDDESCDQSFINVITSSDMLFEISDFSYNAVAYICGFVIKYGLVSNVNLVENF